MAKMDAKERHGLAAYMFGLPGERKYPLYEMRNGKAVPSRTHAIDAKARATQEHDKGKLSEKKKEEIFHKADRILKMTKGK